MSTGLLLRRTALAATLAASVMLFSSGLAPATGGDESDAVAYKFRAPLVNGMGLKSMEELRGKPVLIDFWGTR